MTRVRSNSKRSLMHQLLVVGGVNNIVGEVDQQLSETTLSGRVVTKDR